MVPEVEDSLLAVADRLMETEAAAATEHRCNTAVHHPLVTLLRRTCIPRPRMAVATHNRSLSMACPRKVFQSQNAAAAMTVAALVRPELTLTVS